MKSRPSATAPRRLNTPGVLNQLGKRVTPALGRVCARWRLTAGIELLAAYLNCVIGKGAGSGWDRGEAVVAARQFGDAGPVVLDLGANRGEWTAEVRRHVPGRGRWIAVEPAPECCAVLRRLPGIEVIEAAVGESVGRARLHTPESRDALASLHPRRDTVAEGAPSSVREVAVTTIDTLLADLQVARVDLMKMDLEGHELFALRGAARSLHPGCIRALTFEFGTANVNSRTFFRDFWDLLTERGYRLERIAPGGRTVPIEAYYEDLEYFRGVTNYLALAPSQPIATGAPTAPLPAEARGL